MKFSGNFCRCVFLASPFFELQLSGLAQLVLIFQEMCLFWKPPTRRPSHEKSLDNLAEVHPVSKYSNTTLEHTPDPQATTYEGIPFILGAWRCSRGLYRARLDRINLHLFLLDDLLNQMN